MSWPTHKYNAVRTELDGISFPSKAEARYYAQLKMAKAAGQLVFFLRQVPIEIPGSKLVIDFVEFWADGRIVWTEVKGMETPAYKNKKKAVELLYPFKINQVK